MTEPTDTIDTIDDALEEQDDGQYALVESPDTVDAEVVDDVVENENEAAATTQPRRRGRPKGSKNKSVEAREVATPEPMDEKPVLTQAKAQALTEKIRKAVTNSEELFVEAWNSRIWLSYGDMYVTGKGPAEDFREYIACELAENRPRLSKTKRLELVASLKTQGRVSQKVVAEIVGVDQKTVSNDLRDAEEAGIEVDRTTQAEDGRTYTGDRQPRPEQPFDVKLNRAIENLHNRVGDLTELRATDPEQWAVEARAYRQELARLGEEILVLRDSLEETDDFEDDDDDE